MNRIRISWLLLVRSMRLVAQHKSLLLFPIVTTVLTLFIAMLFIAPIAFWDTGHAYTDVAHWQTLAETWFPTAPAGDVREVSPVAYIVFFEVYFGSMFLVTFFNVAFYHEILGAFAGRPVSVLGGLRFALTRVKAIALWSLLSGVVGLLIKMLEERVGVVGQWIVKLIGVAWGVASVFVIPIIVREEQNASPVRALKTSAELLKRSWGEGLVGFVGLRFGGFLALVGSILLLGACLYLGYALKLAWIYPAAIALWIVGLFAFRYLLTVAERVYLGALYVYAADAVAPAPFERDHLELAWKRSNK